MEQQAPQARPGGGTSDVTVMVVLFIVVTLVLVGGFYYFMYKPKVNAINQMNSQANSKKSQLQGYIKEVMDLKNYEDQLEILEYKWQDNKHYYVLGKPEKWKPQEHQFAIFEAYDNVFELGDYAGVEILTLKTTETFKYYMHDEPWDLPPELLKYEWEPIFATRQTEEGVEASTQETTSMITPHTFTIVMRGSYEGIRRFIEIVQNMEGDWKTMMSIHCYEISEEPSYYFSSFSYRGYGGGRSAAVLYDVSVEVEMLMTFYELNEKGTPSGVPAIPGTVPCSFGGGGGGGGGAGGPSPGTRGGGGTMSMG